jgi:hypothetical protein
MKTIVTLCFAFCLSNFCLAQDYVDLAKFHYATTPTNSFDSIGGNTTIEEFGADLTFPIKLNENDVVITGLMLEQIKTKFHPSTNYQTISTVNLKVGFNKNHSEKLSGTYMLLPKLSSDFKSLSNKDFQIGALILMKYKKNENFKYNGGIYYNQELFGPFFVPLFGFYYKSPNKKFETNITLPIWADMNYQLLNWLTIGTNFSAGVRSYNLSENNAYVVKKTNEFFGYLQFNTSKSLLIQTKVGYSIGRSYHVYNTNDKTDLGVSAFRFGDDRTILNPDFNDGLIFRFRFIYRFSLQK